MDNLPYLLGALRDGSLPKCINKAEVTLAADYSRNWLDEVAKIVSETFSVPQERLKIYRTMANKSKVPCFRLKVYSKELHGKLAKHYRPGSQLYWSTPELAKSSKKNNLAYIAGFYDAEGGCRNLDRFQSGKTKSFQAWCSIRCKHHAEPNEPLEFLKNSLQRIGVTSTIYDSDELVMTGIQNIRRFYTKVPLNHPKKKDDLRKMLIYLGAFSVEA